MSTTSSLQVAQILADLNDLQNTDPTAASALLDASKTIAAKLQRRSSRPSLSHQRSSFDRLGRRITGPVPRFPALSQVSAGLSDAGNTPRKGIVRLDSTASAASSIYDGASSVASDGFRTPMETPTLSEEDMTRARDLVELYEMRGKMKQWGDTGLLRAKERVDVVVDRYKKREAQEQERVAGTIQ